MLSTERPCIPKPRPPLLDNGLSDPLGVTPLMVSARRRRRFAGDSPLFDAGDDRGDREGRRIGSGRANLGVAFGDAMIVSAVISSHSESVAVANKPCLRVCATRCFLI
jgi:hypothetical protein